MIKVRISELKNQLSRYLKAVQQGQAILVLDRKVAVARIVPVIQASADASGRRKDKDDDAFLKEQARLGNIRLGSGEIPSSILRERPPGKPGALKALLTERREGR